MKVIKKGRPQKGWAKEYSCTGKGNEGGGCGAKLLVEIDDLFCTTSSVRDETDYYITFMCPLCGVLTDISPTNLPKHAWELPRKDKWVKDHPNHVVGY